MPLFQADFGVVIDRLSVAEIVVGPVTVVAAPAVDEPVSE
jgi:hypothetical protein